MAPNTLPALAKAGANYMNSQLIRMEADMNGYAEGNRSRRQRPGQRRLRRECLRGPQRRPPTPPLANSALSGITATPCSPSPAIWASRSLSSRCPRAPLHRPTKSSSPAPPPKFHPSAPIDRIEIGDGKPGEVTKKIADEFFGIANVSSPTASAGSPPSRSAPPNPSPHKPTNNTHPDPTPRATRQGRPFSLS